MKTKWIVLTALVAGALLVGAGFATARQHGAAGAGWDMDDMAAMHRSQAMQGMHAQMPSDLRERCEAMHAQMGPMMERMAGMMDEGTMGAGMSPGGMMGDAGGGGMGAMMGGSDMATHHGPVGGGSR